MPRLAILHLEVGNRLYSLAREKRWKHSFTLVHSVYFTAHSDLNHNDLTLRVNLLFLCCCFLKKQNKKKHENEKKSSTELRYLTNTQDDIVT